MHRITYRSFLIGSALIFWKRQREESKGNAAEVLCKTPSSSASDSFQRQELLKNVRRIANDSRQPLAHEVVNVESQFRSALRGGLSCEPVASTSTSVESCSAQQFEKALRTLQIDSKWDAAVLWTLSRVCDDGDLACEDELVNRRPTQEVRIARLLGALAVKLEEGFGRELVAQGILHLLFDLYEKYENSNKNIIVNLLKVLSNIAIQNEDCAMAITESGWLPRLATLTSSNDLEKCLLARKVLLNGYGTFDNGRPQFMTNVYEMHCSTTMDPAFDVIFLHGLRGSVFRTWRQKDDPLNPDVVRCWPRDWLPGDIHAPVRLIGVDYSSSLLEFTGSAETLELRAVRLLSELREAGVGKRPVVFICHSMGGLLVKRMLLDNVNLRKQTVGVLFMATPHKGSPVARYARLGIRPSHDVALLYLQSPQNKQLHDEFLEVAGTIPVICSVAEMEESPLLMGQRALIVPPSSVFVGRGSLYHVKENHHNVCKPRDREAASYGIVLQFFGDVVHHLKKIGAMDAA